MSRVKSHFEACIDRAAQRVMVALALSASMLACLVLMPPVALAQNADMHHLFDGVRRGSSTPEVLQNDRTPFDSDDATPPEDAPRPTPTLQQPTHMRSGVVLTATTKPTKAHAAVDTDKSEPLPLPQINGTKLQGQLPLAGSDAVGSVDVAKNQNGNVTMVVRDASLSKVLALLAQTYHLNIVAANDIDVSISITLADVPLEQALTAILSVANYTWVERNGIILVTSMTEAAQLPADIQGRQIQVFDLDFASAVAVSEAITSLLSPIGKMSIVKSDSADNRRTREMIVVEDQPPSIARIAEYIQEVDQPPRQVLMEAHILQVTLKDDNKCGIDLDGILRVAGSTVKLQTTGLASDSASPAFLATVAGGDLGTVIEAIETSTDTKTLGSPKVLVLNHQEAMVHVGDDIGYQGSQTTTQTSTFQNVQFLQVGVLLKICPSITRDNRVLLHVHPEVSTGAINPLTDIPDKSTTELSTDVMLNDGQGMIIGGLIKENDSTVQSKIPYLGDMWKVGVLFKRSEVIKERNEILVAILPRIQPYAADAINYEQGELVRAETPLFQGPLRRTERPWDPVLPDGRRVVKPYIPSRLPRPQVARCREQQAPWPSYETPHQPYPQQHFAGQCDGPIDGQTMSDPQPEMSSDFMPQSNGPPTDGAVISDRP